MKTTPFQPSRDRSPPKPTTTPRSPGRISRSEPLPITYTGVSALQLQTPRKDLHRYGNIVRRGPLIGKLVCRLIGSFSEPALCLRKLIPWVIGCRFAASWMLSSKWYFFLQIIVKLFYAEFTTSSSGNPDFIQHFQTQAAHALIEIKNGNPY